MPLQQKSDKPSTVDPVKFDKSKPVDGIESSGNRQTHNHLNLPQWTEPMQPAKNFKLKGDGEIKAVRPDDIGAVSIADQKRARIRQIAGAALTAGVAGASVGASAGLTS